MADTFDSRLKLRLQESGGNSGQWGTLLNQTVTNIASVFGYGTHQLSNNADATLTLSDDGASIDALKASYLKITSAVSLTATRTLQFSPNTLNQVKYIENATTGSQSITISQGSGANVTIESGATKVVYFDGAGSGAAVVDALANIDQGTAEFDTIKVATIQANDGTASSTIANSTGVMTIASSVLTTTDINGGTIDGTTIGGSTAAAGSFTTGSFSSTVTGGNATFTNVTISATEKLRLDGAGGHTYIQESSNDTMVFATGGSTRLTLDANATFTGSVTADGLTVDAGGSRSYFNASHVRLSDGYNLEWGGGTNYVRGSNASNEVIIATNGQTAVTVDSSQNVGIGTSSPSTYDSRANNLVVGDSGDAGITIFSGSTSDARLVFAASGDTGLANGVIGYDNNNDSLAFEVAGSEAMRISGGNLGIGTTPSHPLHIAKEIAGYQAYFNNDNGSAQGLKVRIKANDSGNFNILDLVSASTGSDQSVMVVRDDGNIGVGETAPETLMHVKKGNSGTSYSADSADAMILENSNSVMFDIRTPVGNTGGILFSDADARGRGVIQYAHSNDFMYFTSGGADAMQLTSSGQLVLPVVRNDTTSDAANMNIRSSDGLVRRSTSSRRYKNTITDATHGLTELLALRPVTYKGNNDGDRLFGGLIAEEVHDAGLTEFVQYNIDDEPDALAYGHMVSLCIKAIQEQQTLIETLQAEVAALKGA